MKLTNLKYYIEFLFWSISFVALFVLSIITIGEATGSIYDYFDRHEALTLLLTSIIFITPVNIFFYWLLSEDVPSIITKVQNIFLRLLFILSIATIIFLAFGFVLNILQANLLMTDLKISFLSSIPVFILTAITLFGIKNEVSFKLYSFIIGSFALIVTVYSFMQIDSPVKYHAIEVDFENYNSLTKVDRNQYPFAEVLDEFDRNQQLPEILNEESKPRYTFNVPKYLKLNNDNFSLCLNFKHDSPITWGSGVDEVGALYKAGENCFEYTVRCDTSKSAYEERREIMMRETLEVIEFEQDSNSEPEKSCSKYEIQFLGMM